MLVFKCFLLMSMLFVFFSKNWFFIWVLLEVSTLSLVVLLSEKLSSRAVEAISKYFMMQSVGGLFLLFGVFVRLFFCGTMTVLSYYKEVSYVFILFGLFIKLAAFPNPFWFIDVVGGLSLVRGFYVVVISKIVPIYLYSVLLKEKYLWFFVMIGLFSAFFGVLLGVNQVSFRKLMAFSSIGHVGWMIVVFPLLSNLSCVLVFFLYVLKVTPFFFWSLYYSLEDMQKAKNFYHKFLALLMMMLSLLSLAGLPPLVGFFYKWIMFNALVERSFYMISSLLVLLSLISLFFYLQVCKAFYMLYFPVLKFELYSGVLAGMKGMMVLLLSSLMILLFWFMGPFGSLFFL